MRTLKLLYVILFSTWVAACATHPLPEDFEGFNTVQIVERIRCEAQKSIQDEVIQRLKFVHDPLGDELEQHREEFIKFDVNRLRTREQRYFYNRYIQSAIAYAFTLNISEDNSDNAQIDLLKGITYGSLSLELKASSDRARANSRALVVSDTFQQLLDNKDVCQVPRFQPQFDTSNHDVPNLVYPITGSIGLFELVSTFIDLNEEGLLGKNPTDKAPVLTDTLIFTTTLSGTANPQVMLNPVGPRVGLKLASLNNTVTRKDMNQVIVALSLNPRSGYEHAPFLGPFVAGGASGARVFAAKPNDVAAQRAIDAISQQRLDTFYTTFSQAFR